MKKIFLLCAGLLISSLVFGQEKVRDVWTKEQANEWYEQWGWLRGANFIPSTAINQLEMWQAETFDPATIDKELGWAEGIGMNCMRVYLHHVAWEVDKDGFKKRMGQYLDIAEKHGISTIFVIFDDCWSPTYTAGKQPEPKQGVHNSGWLRDPGDFIFQDTTLVTTLEVYVKDILNTFRNDKRIVLWDLYNEPGNSNLGDKSLPLLQKVFSWGRTVNPSQPLSAGVWKKNLGNLNKVQLENSDVITYHNYSDVENHRQTVDSLRKYGRTLICTEYMARQRSSTFQTIMPLLKAENVGAISWGLVAGKTNTIFAWDTPLPDMKEPPLWFCDIFRKDGTPFSQEEIDTIYALSLASDQENGQWSADKANEWYTKQAWILGCNYVPSTAVNDIEMWQEETFDPATIDRELSWAKNWGINSIRVFLNYVVWEADAEGYIKRMEQFLAIAAKHGISVMPVIFDDCNFAGVVAKTGKQPAPEPGIPNSGWVSSPPKAVRDDPASLPKLKAYLQGIIKHFGKDKRIIIWDLYNEPLNGDKWQDTHSLMEQAFLWAREMKPSQPLTIGAWTRFDSPASKEMMQLSDVVSFHGYDGKDGFEKKIQRCSEYGRPVICTEWLMRQTGNTPEIILPLYKEKNVGGYLWGLVNGRTQTHFQWGSTAEKPKSDPWQHDLMYNDGSTYNRSEFEIFKKLSDRK
jgi:hypothetical protein